MTFYELLISLMSIFFVFDSAIIRVLNISFFVLLAIYIISIIEISFISFIYNKIKGIGKKWGHC